jgi:hypothetical protein
MEMLAGVTASDSSDGAVTLIVVEPMKDPRVALITVPPRAAALTLPWAFTVATLELAVLQLASEVMFDVLPSEYVPVALSCNEVPSGTEGFTGVTVTAASPTVTDAELLRPASATVIVDKPIASPVTIPELFTPATAGAEDVQIAEAVTSFVLPSLYVANALNC